jgi:hypothetical protein
VLGTMLLDSSLLDQSYAGGGAGALLGQEVIDMFEKGVGVDGLGFTLINMNTGAVLTTGTPAIYVTQDGGAQASADGAATHEGNGQWTFSLTDDEMDADAIAVLITCTDAYPVHMTLKTTDAVSTVENIYTTVTNIETTVNNIETVIEGMTGPGADTVTMTITADGDAVPDADVWITSDAAGDTTVAGVSQTNSDGEVAFLLDDGNTYYLWMQRDGFNSIQGQLFTAVKDT